MLSLTVLSCKDSFLTVIPESTYSVAAAYQTQSDFVFAIAGVYSKQQELYSGSGDNWFMYTLIRRGDDCRTNAGQSTGGIDAFTDGDNVPVLSSSWNKYWQMIYRCNLILEKIDAVTFTDANLKNYITGEAYALRALSYYNLAWQFGGMPLITNVITVDETKLIARSTQEQTFAQAEADYTKAITLLPPSWTGANLGRVTKYAAEGGLARLYMFQGNFNAAKPLLADIIGSNLYVMEPLYVNCFTDSHDNGKERVWEIQFNGNVSGEGSYGGSLFIPEVNDYLPKVVKGTADGGVQVSLSMISAYEPGDLRKDLSIKTGIKEAGGISNAYRIIKYSHFDKYTPTDRTDWATNYPVIRYTDVKLMYAECLNEGGYAANGEAFTILNAVRARAGLPALTSTLVPTQAAFRTALIQERRVEFAFEGLRWPDLVRWGIAMQVINANFQQPTEGGGLYSMKGDYQKIFAIPSDELNRYNNKDIMWQNPNY